MTQNENIADIGGLSHAYMAYQKYVWEHGAENRLPGLEDLSPEQLFFIGFASVRCHPLPAILHIWIRNSYLH